MHPIGVTKRMVLHDVWLRGEEHFRQLLTSLSPFVHHLCAAVRWYNYVVPAAAWGMLHNVAGLGEWEGVRFRGRTEL